MPVDQKALLVDCQKQLKLLETDLKSDAAETLELDAALRTEYESARKAGRLGDAFEIWRNEQVTQAAVHWVLGCVFVRFLEDNALIDPLLAGPGDRGRLAEASEQAFYTEHPTLHERDWLLHAFRTLALLPGGAALFDEAHNPVFRWKLSPDAAKGFVRFWRRADPATGGLAHDFTDPAWDTRFLGDLYQDLSESARKKYALLQTPVFIEEFILDRTLGEALKALPLPKVTAIDPTCGSGHFLLGAFARLLASWETKEPGALREELAQRALDQVAGVDLNPFAVGIARFRLLAAAIRACGVTRLERSPGFRLHVAVGDTLLHGDEPGRLALGDGGRGRYVRHAFNDEDLDAVSAILGRRYAVVVGNPPYITPKDKGLNVAYRERYRTCHMKYALSVPFVERFWELSTRDAGGGVAGWVGQITADSFMKCAFGENLIEEFFPTVDLTHVISTAGAYIPGHGTSTVILIGRGRGPVLGTVRAVMGVRSEPEKPLDPARGQVWSAIVAQVDQPGSDSTYVSVADVPREMFGKHPWSLGGGGAAELKELLEQNASRLLTDIVAVAHVIVRVGDRFVTREVREIGVFGMTNADEVMLADARSFSRFGVEPRYVRSLVVGDSVRDWSIDFGDAVLFPYDGDRLISPNEAPGMIRWLWRSRAILEARATFGGSTYADEGRPWWEWHQVALRRLARPLTVTFAETSTHNHFALDRGGAVFKQSAPIAKLKTGNSEAEHLGIIGLLSSSTVCFWMKQVCQPKGGSGIGRGIQSEAWEQRFRFNSESVADVPLPEGTPLEFSIHLDALAQRRQRHLPGAIATHCTPGRVALDTARSNAESSLASMVAFQEELDWRCYRLYGVTAEESTYRDELGAPKEPPSLALGERAFEIVLARRMAAGAEQTTWFSRHAIRPITEPPAHWPADYRALVEHRIALIEGDLNVGLIERPEHKRRWNVAPWSQLEREALGKWLLDRLESPAYWAVQSPQTTRDLAQRAAVDPDFADVAALWARAEGVALEPVIRELVLSQAVPFHPALCYTDAGREKRRVWEQVWDLQRKGDLVDAAVAAEIFKGDAESDDAFAKRLAASQKVRRAQVVGAIPRPPKYTSADFQQQVYWQLRDALDVPKERFIMYPYCNREGDDALLVGWAGWNHLQQAQALSGWYADRTQNDGWSGERVLPLLAGIAELIPWLRQWHNELDPEFGDRPGEAYATWLDQELHSQGLTRSSLESWEPPRVARRGGQRSAAKRTAADQTTLNATAATGAE